MGTWHTSHQICKRLIPSPPCCIAYKRARPSQARHCDSHRMSTRTVRPFSPDPPQLPLFVLAARDELKVVHGTTRSTPTEMVDLHPMRDRPVRTFPHHDVRHLPADASIPVTVERVEHEDAAE